MMTMMIDGTLKKEMKLKRKFTSIVMVALVLVLNSNGAAMADDNAVNIPIAAGVAFHAVANQVDPETGEDARVALIDLRTAAEIFWVGACAKVMSIVLTSGDELFPHNGKVLLKWGGYLTFQVVSGDDLEYRYLPLKKVKKINSVDISIHIPTDLWDDKNITKYPNPDFTEQIERLHGHYDVLIFICRSGKRSDTRAFNTDLFDKIYEVDQPNGDTGRGGFQGTSYSDVYNGYRGYPGRKTKNQDAPSVSWSDTGLPVHIGWHPVSSQ